jgi:hypothetical protein
VQRRLTLLFRFRYGMCGSVVPNGYTSKLSLSGSLESLFFEDFLSFDVIPLRRGILCPGCIKVKTSSKNIRFPQPFTFLAVSHCFCSRKHPQETPLYESPVFSWALDFSLGTPKVVSPAA